MIGEVLATVKNEKSIEVRLPKIREDQWNQLIEWKGAKLNYDFVLAGVPHAVVRVPSLDEREHLRDFALEIKRQPSFLKQGTNVTFVRLLSNRKVASVTFERGVEDFTLSCGTGAVASAHSCSEAKKIRRRSSGSRWHVKRGMEKRLSLFKRPSQNRGGDAFMSMNVDLLTKPLKVTRRVQETPDAVSLVLEIPEAHKKQFTYNAGQFVTFF